MDDTLFETSVIGHAGNQRDAYQELMPPLEHHPFQRQKDMANSYWML